MTAYFNKNVLVIGLGMSGRAAVHLLLAQGAHVHAVDRNQDFLANDPSLAELREKGLTTSHESNFALSKFNFDFIVVSPGIPSNHFLLTAGAQAKIEVIGEIELGCRLVKNPVLGITGTNGKTTVTLLVTHVLNQCGLKAVALGNVGVAFSQEISTLDPDAIIVLELSSYQLETLSQQVLDAGVILNITPDHLDRYEGMAEYAEVKFRIERCLKSGAPLYVEEQTLQTYRPHQVNNITKTYGYASRNTIYSDFINVYDQGEKAFTLPGFLRGKKNHDVENLMAAYALCRSFAFISGNQFIEAYKSFNKPSHRIEFILEKNGVRYYDDSKGTNIDAVIRAVEYLDAPIILIAGGVDKGAPYTPWLEVFRNKVKCVCAIGEAAGKMQAQLSHQLPVTIFKDLDHAVQTAASLASEGDVVLLSPGCASLDMFKDYTHRGKVFQQAVRQL